MENKKEKLPTEDEPAASLEHGSHDVDVDGYRIEQRSETEQRSQTKEVRELNDRTEISLKDAKQIKLEEVKSKETVRKATPEEIRAVLEAEYDGRDEVQISKEITMEEFSRLETKHQKIVDGELKTEVTSSEEHKSDEVREGPEWKKPQITSGAGSDVRSPQSDDIIQASIQAPQLEASLPQVNISMPTISVQGGSHMGITRPQISGNLTNVGADSNVSLSGPSSAAGSGENLMDIGLKAKVKGGKGMFGKGKSPKSQSNESVDSGARLDLSGSGVLSLTNPDGVSGRHHEVKHKRHVIEEIIIEDSDKYYEQQDTRGRTLPTPKKKKKVPPGIEVTPTEERRRSTGEVTPMDIDIKTGSVQNVASDEVTFMVGYAPPSSKVGLHLPSMTKFGADWHTGKKSDDPRSQWIC